MVAIKPVVERSTVRPAQPSPSDVAVGLRTHSDDVTTHLNMLEAGVR